MQQNIYQRVLANVHPKTPEELQEEAVLLLAGLPETSQEVVVEVLFKLKEAAQSVLHTMKPSDNAQDHTSNCTEYAFQYSRIELVYGLLQLMYQINPQPQ